MGEKRKCKGTTKAGEPCPTTPLHAGTLVDGVPAHGGYCRSHDPDLAAAGVSKIPAGFGGPQPGSGRPRKPRAVDVLKDWMEDHIDETLAPLKAGLTATKMVVVGNGPGARLEEVPDNATRIACARELLDRGYGRPRQTVDAVVVTDEDLLERIAQMEGELAQFGDSGEPGDDPALPGDEA